MKSKIMVANACQTCDGSGKVPNVNDSELDHACLKCEGGGVIYEWTPIETIVKDVNSILAERMRTRGGAYF